MIEIKKKRNVNEMKLSDNGMDLKENDIAIPTKDPVIEKKEEKEAIESKDRASGDLKDSRVISIEIHGDALKKNGTKRRKLNPDEKRQSIWGVSKREGPSFGTGSNQWN